MIKMITHKLQIFSQLSHKKSGLKMNPVVLKLTVTQTIKVNG